MNSTLNEKLEKLAKKKNLLAKKQKLLLEREKEMERKNRIKKSIEISKLACKANIDSLEEITLLGAFLEISQRAKNSEFIETWKHKAQEFLNSSSLEKMQSLCISFGTPVNSDLKSKMKKMGFSWNKYRAEFYGKGNKEELSNELKSLKCKIEIINEVMA